MGKSTPPSSGLLTLLLLLLSFLSIIKSCRSFLVPLFSTSTAILQKKITSRMLGSRYSLFTENMFLDSLFWPGGVFVICDPLLIMIFHSLPSNLKVTSENFLVHLVFYCYCLIFHVILMNMSLSSFLFDWLTFQVFWVFIVQSRLSSRNVFLFPTLAFCFSCGTLMVIVRSQCNALPAVFFVWYFFDRVPYV